ncbi:MAG: tetratricopeptide repeat protein [Nannocystaceae bacterium]|nr:tetratricopeptide repeat protein [Nannocystaceae bacterium]
MAHGAPMPLPSQPSQIDAQLQHADWFASVGQLAPALGMYRTAALQCEQQGDHARALAIHARIARLDHDPGVRLRIGELQLALGQSRQAAETLDGVVRDELRWARVPQALAAATVAVQADATPMRRLVLADLAQRAGAYELAAEQLATLAQLELTAGRHARAQSLCVRALRLAPQHLPSLRAAADAHLRARDVHRAVAAIRCILAQAPGDAVALEGMAEAFVLLGRRERAAEVMRLLAVRLAAAGPVQADAARAVIHRGLSWQPDHEGLRALDRQLTDRPGPVSREILAEATRVIDLGDLLEVRGAAPPPRHAPPPRRTGAYATAR